MIVRQSTGNTRVFPWVGLLSMGVFFGGRKGRGSASAVSGSSKQEKGGALQVNGAPYNAHGEAKGVP